jgi:hypothetical protein
MLIQTSYISKPRAATISLYQQQQFICCKSELTSNNHEKQTLGLKCNNLMQSEQQKAKGKTKWEEALTRNHFISNGNSE